MISKFKLYVAGLPAYLALCLAGCAQPRQANQDVFDPCGEIQAHILEIQRIDEDLLTSDNLDDQARLRERKRYLQVTDERLDRKCGR